ncbi:allantoinase [Cohnella sp. OV330]|uniref:allantoinase AllB n=1 Tax=Cohnella sp. OV330 TaxID=1855288 RepID=UPI0008E6C2E3|nr:allantoinase AllB [Cohnella sp. OV330]SFB50382.1 allantoinase [Cohnella sp. OV330]
MKNEPSSADRYDLVIINGQVVLEDRVAQLDIGIRHGRIEHLSASVERGRAAVIDADGLVVMPGMIDAHVHLNEPGLGHWEGFRSGSSALAAGGCTTYIDMPLNGIPPTVTVQALELKRKLAAGASYADYGFWGGLMPGYLKELGPLANAGVVGFKAFMSSPGDDHEDAFRRTDDQVLLEGMKRIAELNKVLVLHAEDESIVARLTDLARREGRSGAADYTGSRPVIAEVEAVQKALDYAKQSGCRLHFAHISSGDAVMAIRQAKLTGTDVTLETCPHYLTLTDADLARMGAVAKCAPPLRSREEQAELWKRLAQGDIDLVASDHSPCPSQLKASRDLFAAWGGIAGAQSSLELLVDEGHLKRGIPLAHISRLLSGAPAKNFGFEHMKGAIKPGLDADLVLLDLNEPYILAAGQLYQRHKHSPYAGRRIGCKVKKTLLRGGVIYDDSHGFAAVESGMEVKARQRMTSC